VRVQMRGVNTTRKRGGAVYYYHRATGARLKGQPGSPEFICSYSEAENGIVRAKKGTLACLIREFEKSSDWRRLADSTKIEYRRIYKAIEDEYGTVPLVGLEQRSFRKHVLEWRDKHAVDSPREADNRVTVFARLLAWGADRGPLRVNVLTDVRRVYQSNRSELIWLPEHIDAFCGVASTELQCALMLALHTGQRQGDLVRLTWGAYDGEAITVKQGKTGVRVRVPCTNALKKMLDGMERDQAVILTTTTGRPWRGKNLQHRWAAAMKAAKIEGLHFHDLRGTAVTMLAEAGCTHPEIAAVTGHSLRNVGQILDRYLARTRVLAEHAIIKLENAARTNSANRPANRHTVRKAK
jgi:integrase